MVDVMINNDTVKEKLKRNLELIEQWKDDPANYFEYFNRALTLIELLEVDNCGSVGGFDKRQKHPKGSGYDRLMRRGHWVLFGKEWVNL